MDETLGSYLKKVRKTRNLTLRMVEKRTGLSNAYLSQLETSKIREPSPLVLKKLAECYEISYARLMELAGYPLPTELEVDMKKLEPQFRTDKGFEDLTEEEKKQVREYIEFLRSRRKKR